MQKEIEKTSICQSLGENHNWIRVDESFKTKAGAYRYVSGKNGIIVEEREDE